MDDTPDRGDSRAPEFEDLVGLCRSLGREKVRYVLIGGFAVILHGFVRTTKDIDLLVDPAPDNVRALKRALGTLPDNAIAAIDDDEVGKYKVVRIADEIVIDLLAEACGITYHEAMQGGVETKRLEDVDVPVAGKPLLIRMKQTIRDSDRTDVQFLRLRIEEEERR
ncbi:MAG TPA: DUF6036 family nucleotidyltransferase [Thermoanaerobaculia bacterium]|nr:DUF6036 family nucleotidyltransferase [Thermoanaerobaculia bacterium]